MQISRLAYCTLGGIIAAEAASFLSFLDPQQTGVWMLIIASILVVVLTIRRLEYGVMLLFGELVIGSFGRMLEISVGGFDVSIRMVLWLVVLLIWLALAIKKRHVEFYHSKLFKPYLALAAILGWGIVWGLIRGNALGLIFSDVNNYLYFALVFPVYDVLRSADVRQRVGIVIISAMSWLAVKTIILLYIFSHELFGLQDVLYDWSRHSHLAEITNVDPTVILSRIFMQSQIWLVFGFFVLLSTTLSGVSRREAKQKYLVWATILPVFSLAAVIASFSRSFWLAMVITFAALVIALLAMHERLKTIGRFIAIAAGTVVLAVGLVIIAMRFPVPPSSADPSLIANRAGKFTGEAAVSSRYAQIRPLLQSIQLHPVLGSGFGTSATYKSLDPRVLQNYPDGQYTTTAFELGWLEMWLKLGLLGVGAYLYLIWRILSSGVRTAHRKKDYFILGVMAGLVAVTLTHGISPYLNHPLGIGIVMLSMRLVDYE